MKAREILHPEYGLQDDVLRRYVKDEALDLVYLDPPFRSYQNYNLPIAVRKR